jgi:hypothetical protein
VNKKDAFNAWIDKRNREGFGTIIAPESFGGGWDAALEAAEEVITTTRDAEANTYHANEIEAQARGFTMAARAVRGLRE